MNLITYGTIGTDSAMEEYRRAYWRFAAIYEHLSWCQVCRPSLHGESFHCENFPSLQRTEGAA